MLHLQVKLAYSPPRGMMTMLVERDILVTCKQCAQPQHFYFHEWNPAVLCQPCMQYATKRRPRDILQAIGHLPQRSQASRLMGYCKHLQHLIIARTASDSTLQLIALQSNSLPLVLGQCKLEVLKAKALTSTCCKRVDWEPSA